MIFKLSKVLSLSDITSKLTIEISSRIKCSQHIRWTTLGNIWATQLTTNYQNLNNPKTSPPNSIKNYHFHSDCLQFQNFSKEIENSKSTFYPQVSTLQFANVTWNEFFGGRNYIRKLVSFGLRIIFHTVKLRCMFSRLIR